MDAIWPIMALFGLEEELVDLRASKGAEELVSDMAVLVVVPEESVTAVQQRSVGRLVGRSVGRYQSEGGQEEIPHAELCEAWLGSRFGGAGACSRVVLCGVSTEQSCRAAGRRA